MSSLAFYQLVLKTGISKLHVRKIGIFIKYIDLLGPKAPS